MSQLSGVKRLVKVTGRKMIIEEKDRKSLLEFLREEVEKTLKHEKYIAKLDLRINHSHSTNFIINFEEVSYLHHDLTIHEFKHTTIFVSQSNSCTF